MASENPSYLSMFKTRMKFGIGHKTLKDLISKYNIETKKDYVNYFTGVGEYTHKHKRKAFLVNVSQLEQVMNG